MDGLRYEVNVGQLIGQYRQRTGKHADGIEFAVAQINEVAARGFRGDASHQLHQLGFGNLVKRLADPAGEA